MFLFTGNLFASPIGNKLADFSPDFPFVFWASMAVLAGIALSFVKSSRSPRKQPEFNEAEEALEIL
jgi:hypothetical protein